MTRITMSKEYLIRIMDATAYTASLAVALGKTLDREFHERCIASAIKSAPESNEVVIVEEETK